MPPPYGSRLKAALALVLGLVTLAGPADAGATRAYSLALDGQTAYGVAADEPGLRLERRNAFTIALWLRLDRYDNNVLPRVWDKGPHYLCVMGDPANGQFRRLGLEVQNERGDGNENGGATEFWAQTRLDLRRWYHVVVVFNGSAPAGRRAVIYLDGAPEPVREIFPWTGTLAATDGDPWLVGRRGRDAARNLDGRVDGVHVYQRALGPKEAARLAAGDPPPGATAIWSFDDAARREARDLSGHGNELRLVGARRSPLVPSG